MKDFMKLAEMLLNMFLGQRHLLAEKSHEISQEILNQMRKVFLLLIIGTAALISFCLAMNFLIERLLNQLDQGSFALTPSAVFLLIFLLLCLIVMAYATRKKTWIKVFTEKAEKVPAAGTSANYPGSQIEAVISLLILDFVKEREAKRENPPSTAAAE